VRYRGPRSQSVTRPDGRGLSVHGHRMTPASSRKPALSLPGARKSSPLHHPDFPVGKRVIATLDHPGANWAMVRLPPPQQSQFLTAFPGIFGPDGEGRGGLGGATHVNLCFAMLTALRPAVFEAWRNFAPVDVVGRLAEQRE
jgi:hypothetical protein